MTVHDLLRRCRRTAPILVALCSLAASAGQAGAQRRTQLRSERERIDTTFAFDKNGSVTLTATSGDIVVTGGRATRESTSRHERRRQHPPRRVSEPRDRSRTASRRDALRGLGALWRPRHRAQRSRATSRSATRAAGRSPRQNGDIDVDDVNGHLDVNTLSGDITARDVTGDVEIATISGDVKIFNVRGNVDVGTVSGDIDLRGVTGKTVRAKTTSGDVHVRRRHRPGGALRLQRALGRRRAARPARRERAAHRVDVERRRQQRVSHHPQAG